MGITNFRGDIATIHWYNRRKVSETDVLKYGKTMGTGTIIMGIPVAVTAIIQAPVDVGCYLPQRVILVCRENAKHDGYIAGKSISSKRGATVAVITDKIGAHTATIYRELLNGYERDADGEPVIAGR